MEVQQIQGKDDPKTEKDNLKESLKGKSLTPQDKDAILLQMAKDLGYLK